MADSSNTAGAITVDEIKEVWGKDRNHEQIEPLLKLLLSVRLDYLKTQSQKELDELKKRQEQVAELHDILQAIKTAKKDGALDLKNNTHLQGLLKKAKEMGVNINEGKTNYTKDECNDLVDNIKLRVDDLNVKNDMQLQTLTRLTNETYESYQLARSIMKPLHDDLLNKARSAGGR